MKLMNKRALLRVVVAMAAALYAFAPAFADGPRIVNYLNFVRKYDYRKADSEVRLYEATAREVQLARQYGIPATFLLQYDALISIPYIRLMKEDLPSGCEVGAWFELNRQHVEAAGLQWRGDHDWVPAANIGFATGYTPEEREKLVDVYMARFREIFGHYPHSVGSWYIDAHSLAYMVEKYGIVSSCMCRDQIGTDGYTLWGGYWNQAYYPSRVNAYMPAQTDEGRVNVPVFRMLGPDPIYQYDKGLGKNGQGCDSMEPVYPDSGRNPEWVRYYMHSHSSQPCLAFSYVQVGQENAFTWDKIRQGLEMQLAHLDSLAKAGRIVFQTLEESGLWFSKNFPHTPATAVTALEDVRHEGRRTVWFNSRYYRVNVLEEAGDFRIRDIHLFDESFPSDYINVPGNSPRFAFWTLPLVDGFRWSGDGETAGLRIIDLRSGKPLDFSGMQVVEKSADALEVSAFDAKGNKLVINMDEAVLTVTLSGSRAPRWALEIRGAAGSELPFGKISSRTLPAVFRGHSYSVKALQGSFRTAPAAVTAPSGTGVRIVPASGKVRLDMRVNSK